MARTSRLLARALGALGALVLLAARPAAAQATEGPHDPRPTPGYHFAWTTGYFTYAGGGPSLDCHPPTGVLAFDRTCQAPDASGRIAARLDAQNHLHASALITGGPGWQSHLKARAEAAFADSLAFTSGDPVELELEMTLHGRLAGPQASGDLYGYGTGSEPVWGIGFGDVPHDDAYRAVTGTFRVPVVGGVAIFGLGLTAYAVVDPLCAEGGCGRAWADFGSTAWISNIRAFDAAGLQITSGLVARSSTGVGYQLEGGLVATAAPEPAPIALLGAGAGLLVFQLRRRRRDER